MTVITTVHSYPMPGPIGDFATAIEPDGWDVFRNEHAAAWVKQGHDGQFLLHWIESTEPGHGTAALVAIGEWADEMGLMGRLACPEQLTGFYARDGWVRIGPYGMDMAEMRRAPKEDR